jgi:prolipoprotein diacylglyceryltransferase
VINLATRTRRRSRRSRSRKAIGGIGNTAYKIARFASAPISFLEQISAKDRQILGNSFSNAPTTQKLKILANVLTGRVSGINFFSNEYQAPQTINPSGIINKWTGGGLALIGGAILGRQINKSLGTNIIPATGKIQTIGKQFLIGGALGGFFDDPVNGNTTQQIGTRNLSPQPVLQVARIGRSQGFSSDSVESGL